MASPLRIGLAGALYHVVARGNRREAIYRGDADRESIYEVLDEFHSRFNWRMHAWRQMINPYHLLFETPDANL